MALEQLKVREIVKQAVSRNVDIPEFQREFVWDPEQVKKLAESLYRNYPVGSFLLWDSSEYQETRGAHGTQASLWIVDGQQRTAALCLLLGQKPYWWNDAEEWNKALKRYDVMVNLLPDESDDRVEFALPNPVRSHDPRWVSIRKVLAMENVEDLTPLSQEIVSTLTNDPAEKTGRLFSKVHARLQRLWQIRERDIPIVKITHEVEDVAEIFARLNQEGTRVKEADVTLALAAVRNPGWVRDEYLPFRSRLDEDGWDLDAGIFVRTMTSIGKGRARLIEVPKEFWSPENLGNVWEATTATITVVLIRLAEFGITSADLIPSRNSLIPLFALHHRWKDKHGYRFEKALRWFLLANRDGRYSGSAITSLNEDVRSITDAREFDEAMENLQKRLRVSFHIDESEFLNRYDRASHRFLRLMLYMLVFGRAARDWVDGTRIGYDNTGARLAAGFQPQWHHIYPRSLLRRSNMPDDDIHCLANITVLNERTNVNKLSGKSPARYIREFHIQEQMLRDHLIPDAFAVAVNDEQRLQERWSVNQYKHFLSERAKLLATEANAFMKRLEES
jgi:hypothetical protein